MSNRKQVSPKSVPFLSLIELEEIDDFDISGDESSFILSIHNLRHKMIRDFEPADIRVCLTQGVGRHYLIGKALELLNGDPWLETEYFPGDLLISCIRIEQDFWKTYPSETVELGGLLTEP